MPSTNLYQVNKNNNCLLTLVFNHLRYLSTESKIYTVLSCFINHTCNAGPMYWPMFVVAVLAAIIGSQSLISGTFSVIQQSLSLGCFPRVKVIRTSSKYQGQVYIPEVNYLLMLACVGVTLGFRTTDKIGNAYGKSIGLNVVLLCFFFFQC